VPGVVGQVLQRQDPATLPRVREIGRAVYGQEVEEDGVAGCQGEPADVERARVGVDVGQLGQAALREPARFAPVPLAVRYPGRQPASAGPVSAVTNVSLIARPPGQKTAS
jgi:hypothetical protein